MKWKIALDPDAAREFDNLDGSIQKRISKFLYTRLSSLTNPRSIGEALRGSELGDHWKYRVGDYRLIATIQDRLVTIIIVRLGHRREVYRR